MKQGLSGWQVLHSFTEESRKSWPFLPRLPNPTQNTGPGEEVSSLYLSDLHTEGSPGTEIGKNLESVGYFGS